MKARIVAVALVGLGLHTAFAQEENDDVYFSKKDRQKQQALEPKSLKTLDKSTDDYPVLAKANRKVEGYTGRTINPDYQSKYSTGTEVSSYFVPNYQPRVANAGFGSMYAGNGCYSCNSGWGMRNRMGFGMYSPFYSSFSSAWGYSPYGYNSFWNDPWSNYGYNSWNSWGYSSPYSSWANPYYSSGWGWNMGYTYGWGNGFYGGWYTNSYNNYYVINRPDNSTPRTYGKRSSRNDGVVNNSSMSRGSQIVSGGQNTTTNRGGRVATTAGSTSTSNRYYQRGWRQDPTINPAAANTGSGSRSSAWVGSSGSSSRSTSTWGNINNGSSRSGWNNDSFGGSRSSGSSFNTGGSRSSGSSFGGGSSGGGSRSGGSSSGTRGRN